MLGEFQCKNCPKLDTASKTGHSAQNWTQCQKLDTVSKTGHSVQNWTQRPKLDTVSKIGHSVQTWHSVQNLTQCQKLDTVSKIGHSVQNWTLCPKLDTGIYVYMIWYDTCFLCAYKQLTISDQIDPVCNSHIYIYIYIEYKTSWTGDVVVSLAKIRGWNPTSNVVSRWRPTLEYKP